MRLLHHYPTLSHYFLRNATRLFGFRKTYRLVSVHDSQRKKNAAFYNEKRPLRFTTKETMRLTTKETMCFTTKKKTATFHNGAVSSENTN